MKQSVEQYFVKNLFRWNQLHNKREMPWKGEKDPYKVWLSEIILQQTRVEQGMDYYKRFITAFPTVQQLAQAPDTKVFKLWEGLGYYTRCKNLLATAKYISKELKGKFPDQYGEILALKGIGPYTAAAIASFAFDLPYAVVDGNVFRVLSRYFGISIPIDSTEGKKIFNNLANGLIDKKKPGLYNQALMDFGATLCKPQLPLCSACLLKNNCEAFLKGMVNQLPVKEKFITKKTRWFHYLLIEYNGKLYVRTRASKDIWENLHEFVLVEHEGALQKDQLIKLHLLKEIFGKKAFRVLHISELHKQVLTHQIILGQFIHIKISVPLQLKGYKLITTTAIQNLAFPKFIAGYLKDKNVSLNSV